MAEITTRPTVARPQVNFWQNKKFQDRAITIGATILCIIGVIIILFPVAWMLSTALKTRAEVARFPPTWIPADPQWINFRDALFSTENPFPTYFKNTMFYALMAMIGETLSCAFIAYGFARLRAPGKDILFLLVLATMMLPWQVTLIPQYVMFVKLDRMHFLGLDWINSYAPLIVPKFFGSSYLIFMLRQFYRGLPKDYEEAAIMDGANYLNIWARIILPLSKPALGAVAILSFMYHYNDFMGPLLYINDNAKYPVSLGLQQFRAPFGGTAWHLLMAASLVTVLPPVIVFFVAQRYFIQGIVISGVKG
ncbi:binding-protein-dependent transport systems inner membrane component [Thermobaculum terrenum ATCC BAA-798]|uniref:Binding-protein-dependent transport systems inner membrane component n=1 Tax=Thermobaculum terrenum (strain ATCC BAA-798 / CCMEE 7001 / YNP1) TaxID=525904 RepID=D1CE30_THET1|nr:carbohydrate ABC transporter permease [Thermobaculum terrenum]ACZ41186.1 binding-protein-dependent transport systems inner membrane component [Thermobaculum terrenum ATCC BAA-798]